MLPELRSPAVLPLLFLSYCPRDHLDPRNKSSFTNPAYSVSRSTLRQVPDNQEVYIDKDGFTSIIFDITERVGPSSSSLETDGRALTTHLEELVGDDADTVKVWNTTETQFSHLE